MGCNCGNKGGSCDISGGTASGTRCKACRGDAEKRGAMRLSNLAACEPFCAAPGCPPGAPTGLRGSPDYIARAVMEAAGNGSLKRVRDLATGRTGVRLYEGGPVVACDPDLGLDCAIYGPHGNCSRRDSDISPTDALNIAEAFGTENVEVDLTETGPDSWWMGALGSLGLSHTFCVLDFSVTAIGTVAAEPFIVDITSAVRGLAVAGSRLVCAQPVGTVAVPAGGGAGLTLPVNLNWPQGSYQWAVDKACHMKPGAMITDGRCRCEDPPCASTPSGNRDGGQEWYLANLPTVPAGTTRIVLAATISRCDWLLCADATVCPATGRQLYANLADEFGTAFIPGRRITPGAIPVLP